MDLYSEENNGIESLETEPISTFEIKDNMPEELKQKLMKFNRQTTNLNKIMADINAPKIQESDEEELFGEYLDTVEEETDEINESDDSNMMNMGDLF